MADLKDQFRTEVNYAIIKTGPEGTEQPYFDAKLRWHGCGYPELVGFNTAMTDFLKETNDWGVAAAENMGEEAVAKLQAMNVDLENAAEKRKARLDALAASQRRK